MKNIHNRYSIWFFNFFYANHSIHDVALKDFSLTKHHYRHLKLKKKSLFIKFFLKEKSFQLHQEFVCPKFHRYRLANR